MAASVLLGLLASLALALADCSADRRSDEEPSDRIEQAVDASLDAAVAIADVGAGDAESVTSDADGAPDADAAVDATTPGVDADVEASLPAPDDGVLADWSDRRVTVFRRGEAVARFPAVFGRKGVGKERRGDEKTPGGVYRLHQGRRSRYERFLPVSFPNSDDARRGFRAKLISKAELHAIEWADAKGRMPSQQTDLGGQVGIHGFGPGLAELAKIFRATPAELDGTRGCIMILDEHVHQLERLVRPGVKLVIRP